MNYKLFLFDIDGTLLSPGPSARRAINQAIENYTGIPPNLQIKDVAGLTDRLIVRNALIKAGKDAEMDGTVNNIIDNYLELFENSYPTLADAFVYSDSIKLVNKVISKGFPLGLLTGNVKAGAEIKLRKFDLLKYFQFGVFGDDGMTRNDLPQIAKKVAEQKTGIKLNFQDIVLIGDTPEDATAAKTNGCQSVVVCRRDEWYNDIVTAGADLVVSSLEDPTIETQFLS